MPSSPIAATCVGVVKVYATPTGEVQALKGVDAIFAAGKVTAVVGPSGSGKSSLLRILVGLSQPTAGAVSVAGQDLGMLTRRALHRLRRTRLGYVFQRPSDNLVTHLTAEDHLVHSARMRGAEIDLSLLDTLGLGGRRAHRPHELSGGEQQRLAFASAVVGAPDLVVADEPTAELDSRSSAHLLEAARTLARGGVALVIATHDRQVVEAADSVIELWHGAIASESHGAGRFSIIDGAGRVQLPDEVLDMFPDRRAVLQVEDGAIRITPP